MNILNLKKSFFFQNHFDVLKKNQKILYFTRRYYPGESLAKITSSPLKAWTKHNFDIITIKAKEEHVDRFKPTLDILNVVDVEDRLHLVSVTADYGNVINRPVANSVSHCINNSADLTEHQKVVVSEFITKFDDAAKNLECAKNANNLDSPLYNLRSEFINNFPTNKMYYINEIRKSIDGFGVTVEECTSIISNQITFSDLPNMVDIIAMSEVNPVIGAMTFDYTLISMLGCVTFYKVYAVMHSKDFVRILKASTFKVYYDHDYKVFINHTVKIASAISVLAISKSYLFNPKNSQVVPYQPKMIEFPTFSIVGEYVRGVSYGVTNIIMQFSGGCKDAVINEIANTFKNIRSKIL